MGLFVGAAVGETVGLMEGIIVVDATVGLREGTFVGGGWVVGLNVAQ